MNLAIVFENWWVALLVLVVVAAARYFFIAGLAYLCFYKLAARSLKRFKIQPRAPKKQQLQNEVLYSLSTIVVFSCVGASILWLYKKGYTTIYLNINDHGWLYFFVSILLMIAVHDAYFYWTHRLLHTSWFMKHIHVVHHRSVNPTPLAAYSFHPVEALLESSLVYLFITVFPVHVYAFFFVTIFILLLNVMGHCGFEFLPPRIRAGRIGSLFTSSTHHNLHHSKVHHNYGYYFTFWDKCMHTLHKDTFR